MNSLDFVKQRLDDGFITLAHKVQKDIQTTMLKFDEHYSLITGHNQLSYVVSGTCNDENGNMLSGSTNVCIKYDPVGEFDYVTMESCLCDGTLYFTQELITNIIKKLITGGTCNKEKVPDDYTVNPFSYDLFYVVGDFVVINQFGDFGTKGKPWLQESITVLLPIKCEIKEKQIVDEM